MWRAEEYKNLNDEIEEIKMMLTSFMQRLRVQPDKKTDR